MKKNFSIYIIHCLLLFASLIFMAACSSNDTEEVTDSVSIKMLSPTTIESGEELIIVGSNLDKVSSIIFPENIEVTDFTLSGNSQISVQAPSGFTTGNIRLKTDAGEVVSRATLKLGDPTIKFCTPSDTISVGEVLSIRGTDLSGVKKAILPGNIVIESIDFQRKSADEIRIRIREDIQDGEGTITLQTSSGKILVTAPIIVIAPKPIILFDFEDGSYPGSVWGAGSIVKEGNNSYYKGSGIITGFAWFFATNTLSLDEIAIGSKVLKFDIKTLNPIEPGKYKIQWVMGGQWGWCESGMFPLKEGETVFDTNGEWMTLTLDFGTIGINKIGRSGDFGLACQLSTFDWSNICIDNVRIDPK